MNSSYSDEHFLISSLKNGDAKAYTYLMDMYHHKLCIYATGLARDDNDAEDIVQNVFIKVWKKRHQLKDAFSLQGFLYKSVYNAFIDYYRKQKVMLPFEKTYIDELSSIVKEDPSSLERLITLMKSEIEKLPPKCKQTFLLSKQEGLTNIEIAEHLNVSIKTVEAHITKAFSILRKSIGEKMNGILFLLFGRATCV
ncbi:RNA polymerase sigma factor [Polaribacter porphyrae]|uniref:RNA polymerase sigma-70 factor n=1 Tax=Polaribacter porphyrae TaxID=1137780 RepID=A0A2S7WNU5_9FLAO|nr:RNA polymerase sigma-70 factor [Polaribacter porphyrae]PQJ78982.1 RNA polymerase sigma-70 factor [Polaribacter porphyrae]